MFVLIKIVFSLFQSIALSKRFSPELMNFLVGVVFLSTPKDATTVIPFVPPFKVVGKESTLLCDTFKSSR
jgi:nucleolar protein 14